FNDVWPGDFEAEVSAYRAPLQELRSTLENYLPDNERDRLESSVAYLEKIGFQRVDAVRGPSFDYLTDTDVIIDVARQFGAPLDYVAERYYRVGERLQLTSLRDVIESLPSSGQWEEVALAGLIMDLRSVQRGLTATYLASKPDEADGVPAALDEF